MSRSILEPDASEARGDQQLGDVAFLNEPWERAGDARPPSGVGEWLLELGAATRLAGHSPQLDEGQGHRRRAWSSRRSRRRVVRQALAGTMAGAREAAKPPSARPVIVEPIRREPAGSGVSAIAIEVPQPGPELPAAANTDPSRDDTVEVPAIEVHVVALPPVELEFVDEPIFVRLPPVAADIAEPGLGEEPVLAGIAAWSGGDELGERHSSMLFERISAYTLGPSARAV